MFKQHATFNQPITFKNMGAIDMTVRRLPPALAPPPHAAPSRALRAFAAATRGVLCS